MPKPSRFDMLRKRYSPGWKGSRGIRLLSPAGHLVLFTGMAALFYNVSSEDRRPNYVAEHPPVPAPPPPPGILSFEASCEMNIRHGRLQSGLASGAVPGFEGIVRPVTFV
jgi:hypothetical protein